MTSMPDDGKEWLEELMTLVSTPLTSLAKIKTHLPDDTLTACFHGQELEFVNLRNRRVILIVGCCPQYDTRFLDCPELVSVTMSSCWHTLLTFML